MLFILNPKYFVLLLLLALTSCESTATNKASEPKYSSMTAAYTGLWVAPETDKVFFELDLTQNGSAIEGYHAALIGENGSIEAALRTDREPPSIQGEVRADGSALVHFRLRKSLGEGEAVLTLRGDRLKWKLNSASGSPVLPKSCVLLKQAGATHE
jgi:hypothetical protein